MIAEIARPLESLLATRGKGDPTPGDLPAEEVRRRFALAMRHVQPNLPCGHCRGAEHAAAELPRLGKHERRVLLAAPPPEVGCVVIPPPGPGRSADEAHRRAIRRLFDAGLVWMGRRPEKLETTARGRDWEGRWGPVQREYLKRAVCLSPLGAAVMGRLRADLEAGRPIRWARHRDALLAACRRQPPDLLRDFLAGVERRREWHLEGARFAAAMGSRKGGAADLEAAHVCSWVRKAGEAVLPADQQ